MQMFSPSIADARAGLLGQNCGVTWDCALGKSALGDISQRLLKYPPGRSTGRPRRAWALRARAADLADAQRVAEDFIALRISLPCGPPPTAASNREAEPGGRCASIMAVCFACNSPRVSPGFSASIAPAQPIFSIGNCHGKGYQPRGTPVATGLCRGSAIGQRCAICGFDHFTRRIYSTLSSGLAGLFTPQRGLVASLVTPPRSGVHHHLYELAGSSPRVASLAACAPCWRRRGGRSVRQDDKALGRLTTMPP